MTNLRDAWEAHQTTGPNRRVSKLNTVTQGDYFAILARLALADPSLFMQLLASFGTLDEVWSWLSDEWFSYIYGMESLVRQKLCLLGLTRLLELPSPMQELTLGKLQDYFDIWGTVLTELQEGIPNGIDVLIGDLGYIGEATEYDTPKRITQRQMAASDPVHTIQASAFVRERLQDIIGRVGGESIFQEQWAANVDRDSIARFQTMAGLAQ